MRLQDGFDRYKQDVIVFRNQSTKTEENHDIAAKSLINYLGNIPLSELTFEHVRRWKQDLDNGRSPETVRNYIIKLRVVLAHLKMAGHQCLDPGLIPVPQRRDKVPAFISPEQVEALIHCSVRMRSKFIISLLYSSGIRVNELINLDRSDIKEDTFTVIGKGGKARLCFIDERTQRLMKLYLQTRKDNHPALVVSSLQDVRMTATNIQFILKAARTKAGLTEHVTPHTLRHSFATNLLRNNANIRYVQSLLGHASLETTQMYTHVVDEDLRKVFSQHHTT